MEEVSAGLAAIGLNAVDIHTEPFGPAPGLTPGIAAAPKPTAALHRTDEAGSGPTIEFARSNLAVPWSSDYASLLEFAEACDVPVRWSCRTGVCHNCETALIAGTVDYDPDPVEPPDRRQCTHLLLTAARKRRPGSLRGVESTACPAGHTPLLAPDFVGDLDHKAQLGRLLFEREVVALRGGGEAALW